MFNINPYNKLLEQNLLMVLFRKKITNIYSQRIMNQSLAYWLRNHKKDSLLAVFFYFTMFDYQYFALI